MSSVREIERAIDSLTPQQIDELYEWLDHKQTLRIDAHLKNDLEAGLFDGRISRAVANHQAGNTRPL